MKGKYDSLEESSQTSLPPITVMLTKTMENEEIIHHMRKMGQELAERCAIKFWYQLFNLGSNFMGNPVKQAHNLEVKVKKSEM